LKYSPLKKIVLIGASTGGPGHILNIIQSLPILKDTSVIIAQHMEEGHLDNFASRLQKNTKNSLKIVKDEEILEVATIYVCEGTLKLNSKKNFTKATVLNNSYNPDIDTLFNSFVPFSKDFEILTVILTGIGSDGVDACINLSNNDARCITESEDSAIVDGMPSRARALVANIKVYDVNEIVNEIKDFCDI
jgi:two-component system chemotaxis response regulator CheB